MKVPNRTACQKLAATSFEAPTLSHVDAHGSIPHAEGPEPNMKVSRMACQKPGRNTNLRQPFASASSAAALAFPECGYSVSPLGYVRCNKPGFDPDRIIGLVGYKRDGKSIFANCHMHSVCSVSAGIMVQDVPRDWMAAWLARGAPPPPGASVAERKQLGKEHRKLWKRPPAP